ncbi:9659_t:CDS:2 [Funneliformis caledonium]|uniref:9659_t:CDS:1 n=1 Tax=Funneliformis caledonium TaxID=1117310 RepID=A0A9N9IIL1_9GLOM|nr:9659_t:CDS:2 [Funneliformis caledonium]
MDDVASEIEFLRDNANNSNRMDGEVDFPTKLESITLYEGKKFSTWEICESFLDVWAKKRTYESNSNKDTGSKRTHCPFLINTSCPKNKNPDTSVFVNKIVDKHNHELNKDRIKFEESKKFTSEIIDDIKFMTISCKFGATAQRKFLKSKFPLHPIYLKDLYAAINKFHPTHKSLSNDEAKISN